MFLFQVIFLIKVVCFESVLYGVSFDYLLVFDQFYVILVLLLLLNF